MDSDTVFSPEKVWLDVLEIIKPEIPLQSFNTWFKSTAGTFLNDDILRVAVPNKFASEWIEGKFKSIIESAVEASLGSSRQVEFLVDNNQHSLTGATDSTRKVTPLKASPARSTSPDSAYTDIDLNSRYTFDSFVVGDANRFAHAAALAVAEDPAQTRYNPLYIYGGVGLGKTHLAQAIGNAVRSNFSTMRVLYVTSEKFTNDFIEAIGKSRMGDFARYYRSVDLLLLDDIQFLAGKEATQEQFFHTFNALYQAGKQIVLTSDRTPREINGLEERLLSRFQCGLVTDIQPPDLETRIAILNQMVMEQNLSIDPDVIDFIATNITRNIRELEGSITRLLALSSLTRCEINTEFAYEHLKDAFTTERIITVDAIVKAVCEHFHLKEDQLKSRRKTADLVRARQICMYLCRQYTSMSLKAIGGEFGGRDHSTVIHAVNTVIDSSSVDLSLKSHLEAAEKILKK